MTHEQNRLVFRIHTIQRMFQRHISKDDVSHALQTGQTIEDYPKDFPYPSRLVLGWCGLRPLHIVVAENKTTQETIVLTVYEPDPTQWDAQFTRRL